MSSGFSIWIIALVLINVIASVWLLFALRKRGAGDAAAGPDTTGHVWDGDLREFNNPLPRWWLWMFILSVIFAAGYLVLYPGFGSNAGRLGWTSAGEVASDQRVADAKMSQLLAQFKDKSVDQLRTDPAAHAIGRNLFANNCAICHGSDARGNAGFPNLTDKDWLYGGAPDTIVETISNGRNGVMVGWRAALGGDSGVEDVLAYVLSLSGRSAPAGDVEHGKQEFATICAACHGPDGAGNPALGAPNLRDNIWLYGGSVDTIRDVIANGRNGTMPAQQTRLGPDRVRLLAAYVLSLGDEQHAAQ